MTRNTLPGGNGLTSLTAGIRPELVDLFLAIDKVDNWRPRRIGIAGVRFQSGGDTTLAGDAAAKAAADKAAADKATADAATAAANKGKTADQIAAEKKTADDAAAAAEEAAKKAKSKEGGEGKPKAPDKYELAVPDEAKTAIGDAVADIQTEVEADAKAEGWTNEEAQAELDARLARANEKLTGLRDRWLTETKANKTYGGENLEATQRHARAAVNGIFPEGHELRGSFLQLLNGSGIGNKLEVVAFLATVGKLMGEDAPTLGKVAGKEPEIKKTSDVLFPSSAPKS